MGAKGVWRVSFAAWPVHLRPLSNFRKEGKPEKIVPKISQEDLAQMVGTTRARVNHFMNKFRNLGFIDYNKNLQVRISLLSVMLHEQGPVVGGWLIPPMK
jgi:CRP-like cAMP-binding protein